jgi:hypothetical protein
MQVGASDVNPGNRLPAGGWYEYISKHKARSNNGVVTSPPWLGTSHRTQRECTTHRFAGCCLVWKRCHQPCPEGSGTALQRQSRMTTATTATPFSASALSASRRTLRASITRRIGQCWSMPPTCTLLDWLHQKVAVESAATKDYMTAPGSLRFCGRMSPATHTCPITRRMAAIE